MGVRTTAHSQIFNPCKTIIALYKLSSLAAAMSLGTDGSAKGKNSKIFVSIWILYVCIFINMFVSVSIVIWISYHVENYIFCLQWRLYFELDIFALDKNFQFHRLLIHISYHCIYTIVSISLYQFEFKNF